MGLFSFGKSKASVLRKGSKGEAVRNLQSALNAMGYDAGAADGIFGKGTESALEDWQLDAGLYPDGVFGPVSLGKMSKTYANHGIVLEKMPEPTKASGEMLSWVSCKTDVWNDKGYATCTLRSDVAEDYKRLTEKLHALGAIMTTAGGRRGLSGKASPSRSRTSMHYLGRAFDLALPSGMQNPKKDPYVIVQREDDPRRFVVWARCESTEVPEKTLMGMRCSTRGGKTFLTKVEVTDRFVNFTELAAEHGFTPIRARRSFLRGGRYTGAEWWHFQWEKGLEKGRTTFGSELLRVYPEDEARKFVYWHVSAPKTFGRGFA